MKKIFFTAVIAATYGIMMPGGAAAAGSAETLFKQHCAACHPNGGNIVNPQKTLSKKDRETNKVKTADDIVRQMRNPGPGMSKFDTKLVSDKDAHMIAEYVINTFK